MGKTTRKRYTSSFKSRVVLGAIKGKSILAGLASHHGVHQSVTAQWKRLAIEGLSETFPRVRKAQL